MPCKLELNRRRYPFDPVNQSRLHASCAVVRAQLLDPSPMQRAIALHALELAVADCSSPDGAAARLAAEVDRFTARGIPFYQPQDRSFRNWVDRAVEHWLRLHPAKALKQHQATL